MADSSLFDAFQSNGFQVVEHNTSAKTVNGGMVRIAGIAYVTIECGSKSVRHPVLLAKDINYPFVLGWNTLKLLKATIDAEDGHLELKSDRPGDCNETIQTMAVCAVDFAVDAVEDDLDDLEAVDYTQTSQFEPTTDIPIPHPAVTMEQADRFRTLVYLWQQKFSTNTGKTDVNSLNFKLTNYEPIKKPFLRLSPALRAQAHAEVDRLLEEGIIRPSNSPWSSPTFIHRDKGRDKVRLIADFRDLNNRLISDAYPIPSVTDSLDAVQDAEFVTVIDVKDAYWSLPVDEECQDFLAFSVMGKGHYTYTRAPLGLKNLPSIWTYSIERALEGLVGVCCIVYLDDILIFSSSYEQHLIDVDKVLEALWKANLRLSWKKCKWLHAEVKYLGHIVGQGNIHPDPEKVRVIRELARPKTVRQLRSLLGSVSFFRRFFPRLAERLAPLNEMLRKPAAIRWTEERDAAFRGLQDLLCSEPVVRTPDYTRPFALHTDASGVGIAGALVQYYDGAPAVVAYYSRALSPREQKMDTLMRELLAVVVTAERFRHYLLGHPCTVITDHASLKWIHSIKDPHGILARWLVRLGRFDLKFEHVSGKLNVLPDLLSRNPYEQEMGESGVDPEPCSNLEVDACAVDSKATVDFTKSADPWYNGMKKQIKDDPSAFPSFEVSHELLYKTVRDPVSKRPMRKLVVPTDLRLRIIHDAHDTPTAAHLGSAKTIRRVAEQYYFPRLAAEVRAYVRRCVDCQQHKPVNVAPAGLMAVHLGPVKPFSFVSTDLIGPLPPTSLNRNKYICVIVDSATKWPIIRPIPDATTKHVIKTLEQHLYPAHGYPEVLLSDGGPCYISKNFEEHCKSNGIAHNVSPAYTPTCNGQAEKTNGVIKTALSIFAKGNHRTWDRDLPALEFALRTAPSNTTGFSPDILVYGRHLRAPGAPHPPSLYGQLSPFDSAQHLKMLTSDQRLIYQRAEKAIEKAKQVQAKAYSSRRRQVLYSVGSLVWRKNFDKSSSIDFKTAKLLPRWVGPFKVKARLSDSQVNLEDLKGSDCGRWHVQHLRPAFLTQQQVDEFKTGS